MRNRLRQFPRAFARNLWLYAYDLSQQTMRFKHPGNLTETGLVEQLRLFRDGKEPKGYNEKLKWLMINDQMPEHIICSDKLLCRVYVAGRIGEKYLRKVYQTANSVDGINVDNLPKNFVVKANHDSGSVFLVTDNLSWRRAKRMLRMRMRRLYGMKKGEWAYSYIIPRVFTEEVMDGPIVDYKFHCCDGQICWVQIIYDRVTGQAKEVNVGENYLALGLHLDDKFVHERQPPKKPQSWCEMQELARCLSRGFRYVRVDMYEYRGKPNFGELTFWPRAGNYATEDESEFGKMLQFDTTFKRILIHDFFAEHRAK